MELKKYQVTLNFDMDDEFMALVPAHRTYINMLINKGVIDHYAVSMESQRSWITINAEDKAAVDKYLADSPLFKYWTYEVDELFVLDGITYRLPHVQLN
jgi:muconolactone delta-isomerase